MCYLLMLLKINSTELLMSFLLIFFLWFSLLFWTSPSSVRNRNLIQHATNSVPIGSPWFRQSSENWSIQFAWTSLMRTVSEQPFLVVWESIPSLMRLKCLRTTPKCCLSHFFRRCRQWCSLLFARTTTRIDPTSKVGSDTCIKPEISPVSLQDTF